MKSRGYGSTHIGRRKNNEDDFLVEEELGLYAVADGMGGYEGGEIASRTVTATLRRFFGQVGSDGDVGITQPAGGDSTIAGQMAHMALRQASREIQKRRVGRLSSMGSTAAVLLVRDGCALIAHVGDSRVYRMRDGVLDSMTIDHSLYAEMLAAGMAANADFPHRNVITRAVGVPGNCRPDLRTEEVQSGDVFLLCSDGLTDVLPEEEIEDVLRSCGPEGAARTLVSRAFIGGGSDNITAVVVEVP